VGRLEGKISIVTGTARGIGKAIAELFSREESIVVLVDIDPIGEVEDEIWQKVINVDLTGVFLCTKYAANEMVKSGGGSIVNMSSILGITGSPYSTPYHAAKGGVEHLPKLWQSYFATWDSC
jgi:NAD(P)-dependent dehydrogenase (short-subunit alcohol dehydrogenase family)